LGESSLPSGYTLVICEKPDAAKKIAEALAGSAASSAYVEGTPIFRFRHGSDDFVVTSARGHLYAFSDPFGERAVYPIFDGEWYPLDVVEKRGANASRRIAAIRKLSERASRFVNACDFDVEGETIGFNLLRYACGGKEKEAVRARFSTLTKNDLVEAFKSARPEQGSWLAVAGRSRHVIDFVWGVNLSRFLSQSALGGGHRYRTVSVGRVQGPTLKFLADREREIRGFVPTPYWKVGGTFEKNGMKLVATYSQAKIERLSDAEKIREECAGRGGVIRTAERNVVHIPPYPPFNIGDLQKTAYRAFGFLPSRTIQVAEKLYLDALISYPRTGSQKLPQSIDYGGILHGLQRQTAYAKEAENILRGVLRPFQGIGTDPAHPAIHPTGEQPRGHLDPPEAKVYDLVVRRFLSVFAPSARRKMLRATIAVGRHEFEFAVGRTVYPGWLAYYGKYWSPAEAEMPEMEPGEGVMTLAIRIEDKVEERPPRYNQGSLLEKMERERIGTKATRADTISTLLTRGYVAGEALAVTELGFSVLEVLERYAPSVTTTELTRKIEGRLGAVEEGKEDAKELVRETVRSISEQLLKLAAAEDWAGSKIDAALMITTGAVLVLGDCPVCKTGKLKVIRSRKTKKRFVGCSNYANGCRASAPLPQRGHIRAAAKSCQHCSWPVVFVVGRGRPWRLCVNPSCPSKAKARK
jgi:DNA topoisomerase-1